MAFKRSRMAPVRTLAALGAGAGAAIAWTGGYWGLFFVSAIASAALLLESWLGAHRAGKQALVAESREGASGAADSDDDRIVLQRLLIDAAPTPLLAIEGNAVRALNRAARIAFATDDRVLPLPDALLDRSAHRLLHEGRMWRIDRVEAHAQGARADVVALIDIEAEELDAEARASAELIEVLGHEMLNGLAPIVSLAESARDAARVHSDRQPLLDEILATLVRRVEGLRRFGLGYRALARLPEPVLAPVELSQFSSDLADAFRRTWPDLAFVVAGDLAGSWTMDRDQMHHAVWALLNNAAEAARGDQAGRVTVSFERRAGRLVIAVSDTGPGVPPSAAGSIFRPFHTTKAGGTGVGLTLARRIARGHDGMLTLAEGRPTTFVLRLPGMPPALLVESTIKPRASA
jgi:signal transduction histidine kinase